MLAGVGALAPLHPLFAFGAIGLALLNGALVVATIVLVAVSVAPKLLLRGRRFAHRLRKQKKNEIPLPFFATL